MTNLQPLIDHILSPESIDPTEETDNCPECGIYLDDCTCDDEVSGGDTWYAWQAEYNRLGRP